MDILCLGCDVFLEHLGNLADSEDEFSESIPKTMGRIFLSALEMNFA